MINFPNTPTVNQVFTSGQTSWVWDTVKWKAVPGSTAVPPLGVSGSSDLPAGFSGVVTVANNTGAPVLIHLPTGPVPGQAIIFKDAAGTASAHTITIATLDGSTIDGSPAYRLMSDFMSVEMFWMSGQWGTR